MNRSRLPLALAACLALGAIAIRAAENGVVALPPFLVEEATAKLKWTYAGLDDFEVLSSCPERLTRQLIANHHRLHALLGEMLPPALQFRSSVKPVLIFVDSSQQLFASPEVFAQMVQVSADKSRLDDAVALDSGRLRRPPPPRYTFLPNLRLWDRDAQVLFAIVKQDEFNANRLALTSDYVGYQLRNRLPALPPWFISGVLTLFSQTRFTEDSLIVDRLEWPPATGSASLLAGANANHPLLPLGKFFAGELSSTDPASEEALALWRAQAALLVRWGVGGRGAPRRASLWSFAERSSVEPVTEALFQACFGLDYASAEKELTADLPQAIRSPLTLRPAQRIRVPDYVLRPATELEIARIKGDWERLEVGQVKTQFPALTQKYLERARDTLKQPIDRGSRDTQLLSVIGLCEVDAGNDTAARGYLEEAAAQAKTLRPRANFELARLRFAALGAGRPGSQLTPEQVSHVLTPLLAAREQQPPLAEVYTLIADVWSASSVAPTHDKLAVLEEGVRTFPRQTDLVYRTAELNVRYGFTEDARWQINLGLTFAPDAATRARFEKLQAQLHAVK